jgi:hypothetical protein
MGPVFAQLRLRQADYLSCDFNACSDFFGARSSPKSGAPRAARSLSGGMCCKSPLCCWRGRHGDFDPRLFPPPVEGDAALTPCDGGYATPTSTQGAATGGAGQTSLASRRRFCAVAVSSTSSRAPLKPRHRSRSSLYCWRASVLARTRTWSRTSSSMSRETFRAFAVVHRGLRSHLLQSYMLAR